MSEIDIRLKNGHVQVYKDGGLIPRVERINLIMGDKLYCGYDVRSDEDEPADFAGKTSRKCVLMTAEKALNGRIVKIETDEIFGPNTGRNVHGELEIDKVHKISRYTIEVVE